MCIRRWRTSRWIRCRGSRPHEVPSLVPESFITASGGSPSNPQLCWGLLASFLGDTMKSITSWAIVVTIALFATAGVGRAALLAAFTLPFAAPLLANAQQKKVAPAQQSDAWLVGLPL